MEYEPLYDTIPITDLNELIRLFSFKEDLMVLGSSMNRDDYGRYSFICFDAFASFVSKGKKHYWNNDIIEISNPFHFINDQIKEYAIKKVADLPPLQGGVVGYFGYEANHYLEELPQVIDNIQLPDIYLNFYNSIIAIDHASRKSWIIATGFPEKKEEDRIRYAQDNISAIKKIVDESKPVDIKGQSNYQTSCAITSNFTPKSYRDAVTITKNYILNGDIFETNISQQFSATLTDNTTALDLYFNLMHTNPAPFSAFLKIHDHGYIVSGSPERFIKLSDQAIETCPIKGTRKRSADSHEDKRLADELLCSEKDFAENVMIVDLMRNDLSKVCQLGSVQVDELCALKSFKTVHHLVSKITGKLKNELNAIDVIKASFPPGSVTGAPKIRSMEIISELEKQARGPYCGILGYISFTGDMDTSVIIRTYFINHNKVFFSAGGAIVLDSNPEEEYQESITKAQSLIKALTL